MKITDNLIVQRERVLAVHDQYSNGWSKIYLDSRGGESGPTTVTVQLTTDEVFAKLAVPTIREELDGVDLVK